MNVNIAFYTHDMTGMSPTNVFEPVSTDETL